MEFLACRVCGEDVEPILRIDGSMGPVAYVCRNGHTVEPALAEREARCPHCGKKLLDHVYGHVIGTCPRCKQRFEFER